AAGGERGNVPGGMPGMQGPPGMRQGGPPSPMAIGGQGPGESAGGAGGGEATPASTAYLTVHPNLKAMLDRVEAKGSLFSMATDSSRAIHSLATGLTGNLKLDANETTLVNTLVKAQADLINTLGAAVELKEGITVTGGLEYRSSDVARTQFT